MNDFFQISLNEDITNVILKDECIQYVCNIRIMNVYNKYMILFYTYFDICLIYIEIGIYLNI